MGTFETSDQHGDRAHRPLRVPTRKEHIYREALELIECLAGWKMLSQDKEKGLIQCEKAGGMLGGKAEIQVSVQGSDEHPTTEVNVRCTSTGGLFSRDKAIVTEFMTPFIRRVV
ncbi:MAG: DUF1499 domain-containing protein [Planctomycetes bacterium]|jgi:hypothetical protein|nr:DUF1499 domain-containing protein [Planctomycetota bacterium]